MEVELRGRRANRNGRWLARLKNDHQGAAGRSTHLVGDVLFITHEAFPDGIRAQNISSFYRRTIVSTAGGATSRAPVPFIGCTYRCLKSVRERFPLGFVYNTIEEVEEFVENITASDAVLIRDINNPGEAWGA